MARIPVIRFGKLADHARQLTLTSYAPSISLEGLVRGVDNVRHDVFLSQRLCDEARAYVNGLITRHGNVADLAIGRPLQQPNNRLLMRKPERGAAPAAPKGTLVEFKRLLTELLVEALNRAKTENNVAIDVLARLAVVKLLRAELAGQFSEVLERCRTLLKSAEGPQQEKAIAMRERVSSLQVAKKTILRRAGQELFENLRDIEKQTLVRMRRSLFGDTKFGDLNLPDYDVFLNRLIFTEDGRDDHVNAEHYVMMGNYDRDPDRFSTIREVVIAFLQSLGVGGEDESALDGLMSAPENAQELVAGGNPDESTPQGKAQRALLSGWVEMLQDSGVMDFVAASYETVALLPEYSPTINAQQLKNALVSRQECSRVESLIAEHTRLSADNLNAAVRRLASMRGQERAKIAGRFLGDFMRYHRDLRRLEALNSALDSVNIISNDKLRELSSLNHLLYEFLIKEEQKPSQDRIVHHVVIKADVRDSTKVTRALCERDLNPASYFSLNFYDPVNKLLAKYGASKVFLEGDAVILALMEREGERRFAVSRACVLAREMVDIVRAYNQESQKDGLPMLELGVGIAYHDAAPMYLMDGETRIMISEALNESDRLSSCSKKARHVLPSGAPFNVYRFQLIQASAQPDPDEPPLAYNIGGIQLNVAAFAQLQREISLQPLNIIMPPLWTGETFNLYSGLVPLDGGLFHRLVIREAKVAQIAATNFSLQRWSEVCYYEVCTNPAVYQFAGEAAAAAAGIN